MEGANPQGAGGKEWGGTSEKPEVEKGRKRADVRKGERELGVGSDVRSGFYHLIVLARIHTAVVHCMNQFSILDTLVIPKDAVSRRDLCGI